MIFVIIPEIVSKNPKKIKANISGEKLKYYRLKKKILQVEVAAHLVVEHGINLAQSHISEIERGKRSVKDFELVAIANVLGIEVEQLLTTQPIVIDDLDT